MAVSRRIVAGLGLASIAATLQSRHLQAQSGRPLRIVALGDSLTAGLGLPASAAFPVVLQQALNREGPQVQIANAGVSGDTAAGGLDRLDWSTPDGTDAVIVELGANDMLRGIDPAVTEKAIDQIVERLTKRGVPVLLAGMQAAPNLGADYAERFNGLYKRIAEKHGAMLYPFFLDGVAGQRALNQPDGMHPTADGVKVIVERMLPTARSFIDGLKRKQG